MTLEKKTKPDKRKKRVGEIPGTIAYHGPKKQERAIWEWICYDEQSISSKEIEDFEDFKSTANSAHVDWVNLDGLHEVEQIKILSEIYSLDHLTLEDILSPEQRPKVEEFEKYLFFTFKMFKQNENLEAEQVSLVLTGINTLVTFQEQSGDIFDPIRERIQENLGRVRKKGADYLFYLILDIIVDDYFIHLERINSRLLDLEEKIINESSFDPMLQLQKEKKELNLLSRSIFPLRDAINKLLKVESGLIRKTTIKYFRDLYDHTLTVFENIENQKDTINNLRDLYATLVSNRMNGIMKILTIVSSIFIPLTFIAGIYGMNFENMPELKWKYGYFVIWGIMVLVTGSLLWLFKKRKWL
ncbi:MAG: magnesium/cobalt transporter CorA [Flavobacteriales bacterium]|nr:magnesium/cobalt transporter CorA [Flavobacteriales bacterium]